MATFATVDNTNLQAKEMANEIILSYSEHRQVVGDSAVSAIAKGDDAQYKTLWLAMQAWMIANCVNFVNHNDAPNVFTEATWLSTAGLNAGGFSRYQDGALLGYGNMQKGDDRCILNFQELQKGLSALRWTSSAITWSSKGESNYAGFGASRSTWIDAKDAAEALWASIGPWSEETPPLAFTKGWSLAPDSFHGDTLRSYSYAQASGITDQIQHSASLYLRGVVTSYFYDYKVFDANGDSISELMEEQYTSGESADTSYEQKVGKVEPKPTWCAEPAVDASRFRGWELAESFLILKWNGANGFSYTL